MSVIFTDNLCDLSKEEIKKFKVEQISFPLTFFGNTYKTFDDFNYDDFNTALKTNDQIKISMLTKDEYIEYFKPILETQQDIIFIHASAKLYSTTATLNSAIEELNLNYPNCKITVIDSYSVSIGEGAIVKEVARKNIEGATHLELVEFAKSLRKDFLSLFVVDNVKTLKEFNKLNSFNELIGGMLGIKPIFSFDDFGKLILIGKSTGRKKAIMQICEIIQNKGKNLLDYNIEIVQYNAENDAEILKQNISNIIGSDNNIFIKKCNPIVTYFTGNSILGVTFRK